MNNLIRILMSTILAFSGLVTRPALGQVIEGKSARDIKVERNFIKDGDAEIYSTSSVPSNMVTTGGTLAISTSSPLEGSKSFTYASTTSGQLLTINFAALSSKLKNGNCEASFAFSNTTSSWKTYVTLNSVKVSNEYLLPLSTDPSNTPVQSLSFPCGDLTYAPNLVIESTAASAGTIKLDAIYGGKNTNIGTVAQAQDFGSIKYATTTNCVWQRTGGGSNTLGNFSADTDCPTPTATGNASAPGTKIPGVTFASMPPGTYRFKATGFFRKTGTANDAINYRFSDGTNNSAIQLVYVNGTDTNGYGVPVLTGSITYTAAQSNVTIQVQGATSNTTNTVNIDAGGNADFAIEVDYFPSAAQTVVNMNQLRTPTIQKFTSGSGTYTTPVGVTHISIRMVGGGAGGSGSGTGVSAGTSGAGGDTTFGTSLLTANGGSGANAYDPGNGGAATINTPAIGTATYGNSGQAGFYNTQGAAAGAQGAPSCFGGAKSASTGGSAGSAAVANSGASGAGGGTDATGENSGASGGSGGCIYAIISSPSSTYAYSVGAAGTAGTAGTSGFAGGAGGSGYIEVTEYYGNNMPLLVGGVTSNTTGMERVERITFGGSTVGNSNCTSGSCTVHYTSVSGATAARSAQGIYTVSWPSGSFSSPPTCSRSGVIVGTGPAVCGNTLTPLSATSIGVGCYPPNSATATDAMVEVTCQGPR